MKRVWNGTLTVHEKHDAFAIVELSYTCPYCGRETATIMTVYSESFHLIEKGGFYERLSCSICSEEADVICP